MFRRCFVLGCLAVLPFVWSCPGTPGQPPEGQRPPYRSPLGLAVDEQGRRAYVALHTAGVLAVVDLEAGRVIREVPVGAGPYDVVRGGDTLWVTCEADDTLVAVAADDFTIRQRIPIGRSPRRLAVRPDGSAVYVACHDEGLRRYDPASGTAHEVFPGPGVGAVGLRPGLNHVTFLVGEGAGGTFYTQSPGGDLLDSETLRPATNVRGLALLTRAGRPLVLTVQQRPTTGEPTTHVPQAAVFANVLGVGLSRPAVDGRGVDLDGPDQGCADPADLAVNDRRVFVAAAGADQVVAVDLPDLLRRLDGDRAGGADSYDPFLQGRRRGGDDERVAGRSGVAARIPTQANPRRLALSGDGKTLVVSDSLADALTVIDADRLRLVKHIPLGGAEPDAARRGETLFNSNRVTFRGRFTCASCHPDGAADGLNWDLTAGGIGNFKNTKSLQGVLDTAPYGWRGESPTLSDRVAGTLQALHHHEPAGTEVDDLAAYLRTLPPPRPLPVREADRAAVARGRDLFLGKGECASCHRGDTFQDGKAHDLGTGGAWDVGSRFDTPSLRGVARTAPYLHDGRAATLEAVFTQHNPLARHGAADLLTKEELADLVAYLKSL
jgi:DNA-binding beta-propeller fold protein YncE